MSVPIAVVNARTEHDSFVPVGYPSFSPRNSTGSFQNRFYPGGSPGLNLGPIAMPERCADPSAWLHAVHDSSSSSSSASTSIPADDLCRNYVCCGVALPDLHALVEHFESHHVEVIWPPAYDLDTPSSEDADSPPFDADDMDISSSDDQPSPSPPPTAAFDPVRVSACFRTRSPAEHQHHHPQHHHQQQPPPYPTSSYSSLAGANGPTPFNRYAAYAHYSSALPGTHPSPSYPGNHHHQQPSSSPPTHSVPPSLLFSTSSSSQSSPSPSPITTPASSRTTTPAPVLPLHPSAGLPKRPPPHAHNHGHGHGHGHGHHHNAVLPTKPFRCPKPNCNKSYKQQNGLKYHLSHGQCNFAPRDPAVDALTEVERERRLRPFVCAVQGECGRRYKNMNGLRYHYTHTGEHGARGLEMLAQGVHPLPDQSTSMSSSTTTSQNSTPHSSAPGTPLQLHTQHQQQHQQQAPSPLAPFPVRAWD